MKAFRIVAAGVVTCALGSAALTSAGTQKSPNVAVQQPAQPQRTDPKWVESMQRLLKDLTDDNAKLRSENDALKRKLEAYEAEAKQRQQMPNIILTPPAAPRDSTPPSWRPFEFNGATYYVVPCKDGKPEAGQVAPQGPVGDAAQRLYLNQAPPAK